MKCAICGRIASAVVYCSYGYCSEEHLRQLNERRKARFEAMRGDSRQDLPTVVSRAVLKRHLLRVSLEMIWELSDGDPINYEEEFIPEMFVCSLEGKVIQFLPARWARAFDRDPLELSLGTATDIPREIVQAAIDQALGSMGRGGEEF
jgi:hypothetical protein